MQFLKSVENSILLKIIQKEDADVINAQQGCTSDSGTKLNPEIGFIKETPINICLYRAAELFEKSWQYIEQKIE